MNDEPKNVKLIFAEALEKPASKERVEYLNETCGEDSNLRAEVEELLKSHEQAGDFMEAPALEAEVTLEDSALTEGSGSVVGRYKLLEKIGEGGFGVVWAAAQKKPVKRRVALKIIKLGMDTREVVARFEAERQALAMMDHPNIAKVLDAGSTDTGRPYFVMELVRGIPITEYCDQAKLSVQDRLGLFIKVCNAVQHAHQKGIIHRDIKPSNILITLHDGVPVPRIIDFGIAKATQLELTEKTLYTQHHQFIGTPAYMSPEQAEMSGLDIDTRSDIYSLGVLLYELLTGRTPFDEKQLMKSGIDQMRKIIREQEPQKPSTKFATLQGEEQSTTATRHATDSPRLISLLRGDLDWIVMKCLEKDRRRRYETANGLALDVVRHLNNEPVTARPPTIVYQLQKAWRRNKVVFTAAATVAVILFLAAAISLWQALIANAARKKAVQEENKARENEVNALRHAYNSDMSLAFRALEESLYGRVWQSVRQYVPEPGEPDFRGWEWRYAWAQSRSDAVLAWDMPTEVGRVFAVRISRDQRYMVTSGFQTGPKLWPHFRRLWNFQTREQLKHVYLPNGTARGFAFSNSGEYLALHCNKGNDVHEIHVYDTNSWKLERTIPSKSVYSLSFSPDDETLATYSHSVAVLWDWRRKAIVHQWPVQSSWGGRHDIAFFPDGCRLAIGGAAELKIVDISTGSVVYRRSARRDDTRLAISPDSRYVAIGSGFETDEIGLLNTDSWEQEPPLKGHSAWVIALAFTPSSKQLISASADHTLRVWDMQRRVTTRVLKGHQSGVHSISLTSDASRAVSGGEDGQILEWDLNAPQSPFGENVLVEPVREVVFSADSRLFYTIAENGSANVWDANTFTKQCSSSAEVGAVSSLILFPDGGQLIAGSKPGDLWVLDAEDLHIIAHRTNVSGQIHPVGFTADGTLLVTVDSDNTITLWDIDTWQLRSRAQSGLQLKYFGKERYSILQDSSMLLCVSGDSDLVWWDLARTQEVARIDVKSRGFNNEFAVSPTEPLLASIAEGDFINLWNWRTRRPEGQVHGPRDFHSVAFSPDGRRMLSGSSDTGSLRLWDASTRQEIARLGTDVTQTLVSVQFSPDGNMICAVDRQRRAHFWRAPSWERINAIEAEQRKMGESL